MSLIYNADDEANIREIIKTFLENEGHQVISFKNGDDLYEAFQTKPCDLVILDIMMPGTDGLMTTSKLRTLSNVPIIILSARDTDGDQIAGISLGGDDYITKPFKPSLLVMKVKAILRRVDLERLHIDDRRRDKVSIEVGDLIYSEKEHQITCKGKRINLTSTELKFLSFMMEYPNEAISKNRILDEVWDMSVELETRVADETNRRIRKKLANIESVVYIETMWGFGFKLVRKDLVNE